VAFSSTAVTLGSCHALRQLVPEGFGQSPLGSRLTVVTSLPTWAVFTLSFGSPLLTAIIAYWGQRLSRYASKELEARSRREEVMRNLRWASELAVSEDRAKSRLGIKLLKALRESELPTPAEEELIDAALDAVLTPARKEINQSSGDIELVVMTGTNGIEDGGVSSEDGEEPEDGGSS